MDSICNYKVVGERHNNNEWWACTKCDLHKTRTNVVWCWPDDPTPYIKLMFIGEGPGEQEDLKGFPFAGRSGELLHEAISEAYEGKYYASQIYITNTVKCRPPGNRNPTPMNINLI